MDHVFTATAACIIITGSYEDTQTDVTVTVVSVRWNAQAAQQDLLAWAKAQYATDPPTGLRLAITEVDPQTGQVTAVTA